MLRETFDRIYHGKGWGNKGPVSGPGASLANTAVLRVGLPAMFRKYGIQSILDAPCGDFTWMASVNLSGINYIGCDIVQDLMDHNTKKYGTRMRSFMVKDITSDPLPKVDLIVCRDCLIHLSYSNGIKAINNFKASGSKYLFLTYFKGEENNHDIEDGGWRTINPELPPYSLGVPGYKIPDHGTDGKFTNRYMGLWTLNGKGAISPNGPALPHQHPGQLQKLAGLT